MENFEKWLMNLPTQTLTDELKQDILELLNSLLELERSKARVEILQEITKIKDKND